MSSQSAIAVIGEDHVVRSGLKRSAAHLPGASRQTAGRFAPPSGATAGGFPPPLGRRTYSGIAAPGRGPGVAPRAPRGNRGAICVALRAPNCWVSVVPRNSSATTGGMRQPVGWPHADARPPGSLHLVGRAVDDGDRVAVPVDPCVEAPDLLGIEQNRWHSEPPMRVSSGRPGLAVDGYRYARVAVDVGDVRRVGQRKIEEA